jgi:long-subunit fatty acid transport protein
MNKIYKSFLVFLILLPVGLYAGNPDRQGEAGAYELLMNPWAKSAGLHTMNTSSVFGVEAMRLNVAGLANMQGNTEFALGHTQHLRGTDISMNALGLAQKMGKNGVLGISVVSVRFGDIQVTTTDSPEGTGATFSPNFFNLGISYAHKFENKVSVGILLRAVSESTADLNAFGAAIDAGVQYTTGPKDNFKLGIALRNVGTPMRFSGEGLSVRRPNPTNEVIPYQITYDTRAANFEMPSMLNMGASYDFYAGTRNRITVLGNFTSNSFSRDQVGLGLEYSFNELFSLRAAYRYDLGSTIEDVETLNIYTGLAAGFSFNVPISKYSDTRFGIDYAYRATNPFLGTHNLTVRFIL